MKKNLYIPSISLILWKRRPISFDIDLAHFSLSGTFMSFLYYWTFPVSGNITALIWACCTVNLPMLVSLIAQSYSVWMIITGEGAGAGILRDGVIVII